MASDDHPDGAPRHHLIPGRHVQGTKVYNAALEDLGTVDDVVIDAEAGRIAYAVLSCGGFFGLGERHYPVPWAKLRYEKEMGGYIADVERDVMHGAPSYGDRQSAQWNDEEWARAICAHYGVPPLGNSAA